MATLATVETVTHLLADESYNSAHAGVFRVDIVECMAAEQSSVVLGAVQAQGSRKRKKTSHCPELKLEMTPTLSRKGNKTHKVIMANDRLY